MGLSLVACADDSADKSADVIYSNGHIIPMTGKDQRVEAVAVKEGKIMAVGNLAEIQKFKGKRTQLVDLAGKTMTPGFIDAHGHFAQYIPLINATSLYPSPMGTTDKIADIQAALKNYFAQPDLSKEKLHLAYGYDDAELAERRHPTRWELDEVTQGYGICAMHISGHLATCNSQGLEMIGYNKSSDNPDGGILRRDAKGALTGTIEESATYAIFPHLTVSGPAEATENLLKVQTLYNSYGITTAQEGLAMLQTVQLMKALADNGAVNMDITLYAKWLDLDEAMKVMPMGEYHNGVKLAGVKMVGDGSPQGKTAYLSTPYFEVPHNHAYSYHGYPVIEQADMDMWVDKAYSVGAQVLSHTNGDASTDILLNAIEKANKKYGLEDRRPVAIHAQTVRLDQVQRMKQAGIMPSFFPAHTYFWGDFHRDSVLGPWRASNISPTGWANEYDLPFTIHMDAPVLFPDMMRNMWTAVNRVTRSGQTLGENHKISPYQALEAITVNSAYQHFEEASKGSIEVGKRADLVILDRNPLTVPPMEIKDIQVLETIKDGNSIYKK